ncbi:nrdI protein [Eggerthia catenaformis OT 569 = DSM 20559]|uniref:NrdI protein n=1 Tax=Eggerthia catenaformis OT 569 = DSM 20559 TaxID=999415 RepID=M2P7J6_9FIRM|nr:class Ib ribonucleoside-diphosphate reductase assembly flavoprotein NrdI [Eggerthia catenaformis]EMD16287.1 nrdI protein [Eggerthia catenaformis OT 569 = DSM 20559]
MKIVYSSRTGNVESIVNRIDLESFSVESIDSMDEDYVIFTYTDGYGEVPYEVEEFLSTNADHLKGVVVSGDQGYGEAYCQAGDVISDQYNVPCLYKVENDGTDEDIEKIKEAIETL